MNNCPKCNSEYKTGETACPKCGIIFEKYLALQKKQNAKRQSLMMKCKVCDKEISKNTKFCPHCGEPNKIENTKRVPSSEKIRKSSEKKHLSPAQIVIGLMAAFGMMWFMASNDKPDKNIKNNERNVSIDEAKNKPTGGAGNPNVGNIQEKPIAKIVSYKTEFRRNSPKMVEYLSLVIFFSEDTGFGNNPYEVQYKIKNIQNHIHKGIKKSVGTNLCKHMSVPSINQGPRPAYANIILKSQQEVKPAITKGLVQNGEWWITDGFEYPSFNPSDYKIAEIQIIDMESGTTLWSIQ